jgi:CRISPR-associated exonuclease Cas4
VPNIAQQCAKYFAALHTVDANLRAKTELTVAAVRHLLQSGEMPPPLNDDHCRACSLRDLCQPEALAPTPEHAAVRHSLFEVDD